MPTDFEHTSTVPQIPRSVRNTPQRSFCFKSKVQRSPGILPDLLIFLNPYFCEGSTQYLLFNRTKHLTWHKTHENTLVRPCGNGWCATFAKVCPKGKRCVEKCYRKDGHISLLTMLPILKPSCENDQPEGIAKGTELSLGAQSAFAAVLLYCVVQSHIMRKFFRIIQSPPVTFTQWNRLTGVIVAFQTVHLHIYPSVVHKICSFEKIVQWRLVKMHQWDVAPTQ